MSLRELFADLRDDLRWTLRSLRRSPAYALASGATLALVVAANALVFTIVYAVLLRPLPYVEADRLLALNEQGATHQAEELSYPNLEDLRSSAKGIATIGAWVDDEVTLVNEDTPRITVSLTTPEFFPVLGTRAALGRTLEASDANSDGAEPRGLADLVRGRSVDYRPDHPAQQPDADRGRRDAAIIPVSRRAHRRMASAGPGA